MNTRIITTILFSILIVSQSCDLQNTDYTKITPETFYKTQNDAKLAVAALYNGTRGLFSQNNYSYGVINDVSSGDQMMGVWGTNWERLYNHQWSQINGYYTDFFFTYYKQIAAARIVVKEIAAMDISDNAKKPLVAEANAMAGWIAYLLYDWHGSIPYPTDESLTKSAELNYPLRPTNEEFVNIIENFFSNRNDLLDPDFGSNFGRMNKGIANLILMRLYMLEAARTGNANFWQKAQSVGEEIINLSSYTLQSQYSNIFSLGNKRNNEIIFAPASDYSFGGNYWHTEVLPSTMPSKLNEGGAGSWAVYRMVWPFYDTFNQNDLRLSGITASYVSTASFDNILIDREHPFNIRNGVGGGPFPLKYELDPNQVGVYQGQDFIIYRYAEVLLSMAEILNELGTNANVNAPIISQVAKNGDILQSDGGNTAFSFVNAIRVRAGLTPLSGLSKNQLRDSILMERGHELYCEGTRRTDLIRYQRMTDGNGYKIFDADINKFLMPIPNSFIDEFKGNMTQNPGY